MLGINDINLLQAQNEGLKKQNKELQEEIKKYAAINEQETKDYAELKAENERLKFKLDAVEADYEASEIEIEDLKNKLNLLITANNHLLELDKYRQKELETKVEATKSNIHNLALLSKARKTLQEIKAIAETPKLFIDFSETKTATEVEYDYATICNELELRLHKVLELITKAEEE